MQKLSLSLLTLIFTAPVFAADVVCTLTESFKGKITAQTDVRPVSGSGHALTPWENSFGNGFVALSQGQTVVNIITKADGRNFSFHGKTIPGEVLNGTTCLADLSTCLTVTCR